MEIHIEELLRDGVFSSLVGAPVWISGRDGGGIHNFAIDYLLLIGMEQLRRNLGWPESLPEVCGITFSGDKLKTCRRVGGGYLGHLARDLGSFCCHDVSVLFFFLQFICRSDFKITFIRTRSHLIESLKINLIFNFIFLNIVSMLLKMILK